MVGDQVPPAPQWRQCTLLGLDLGMAVQLRAKRGGDEVGRQRGARMATPGTQAKGTHSLDVPTHRAQTRTHRSQRAGIYLSLLAARLHRLRPGLRSC